MKNNGHKHAEAFMHMIYYGQNGQNTIRLRIWNSRDGVTPFMTYSKEYGVQLQHVNWQGDVYDPNYKPKKGDLIWVSHTEETARQAMERNYLFYMDHLKEMKALPEDQIPDTLPILETMIADKEKFIKNGIHEILFGHGEPQPHLVIVEEDWK